MFDMVRFHVFSHCCRIVFKSAFQKINKAIFFKYFEARLYMISFCMGFSNFDKQGQVFSW